MEFAHGALAGLADARERANETADAANFAAWAKAAADLKTLGGFPAVEANFNQCIAEMTLITRKRHALRMAPLAPVQS